MRSADPSAVVRPTCAVLLAGAIRPSPLREAIDGHVLCLPVGVRGTLLDAWMDLLERESVLNDARIVVNTPAEVDAINAAVAADRRGLMRAIAEPAAWRGAAGIVGDVANDVQQDSIVIVCEAKRLPPNSLAPLIGALSSCPDAAAVVGVCGRDEPAGVYAFTRSALCTIPRVGYYDLKEQFLPALSSAGQRIRIAGFGDRVHRLQDVASYLSAVRTSLCLPGADRTWLRISDRASVSSSAVIDGACIVEDGAVIEDGAVVHESVILAGATVGGGAVVSRSVIGQLATVEPRSRVMGECMRRSHAARPSFMPAEMSRRHDLRRAG